METPETRIQIVERRVWRRTLISAWSAQVVAIMGFQFVMPFLRLYLRDELNIVDDTQRALWSGYVFAAPGFVMGFTAPFWGIIADKFGRKVMVMRAMFGGAVIVGLMGLVTTPGQLLALRLAQGALTGTVTAAAALVASVSPSDRSGFSMGMMQAAIFAGNAIGPIVGGLASDSLGSRAAFFIAGGLLLGAGVVITIFASEGRSVNGKDACDDRVETFGEVMHKLGFVPILLLMFLMTLSGAFPGVIFQEFVELIMGSRASVNTAAGGLMALMYAVAAVTSALMGRAADRIGYMPLLICGTIISGLLSVPQAFVQSLWQLAILRALVGVAAGTTGPAMGKFVCDVFPRSSHGRAFGVISSVNSFAFALGPLAGGLVNAALISAVGPANALRIPFVIAGIFQALVGFGAWGVFSHARARRKALTEVDAPAGVT